MWVYMLQTVLQAFITELPRNNWIISCDLIFRTSQPQQMILFVCRRSHRQQGQPPDPGLGRPRPDSACSPWEPQRPPRAPRPQPPANHSLSGSFWAVEELRRRQQHPQKNLKRVSDLPLLWDQSWKRHPNQLRMSLRTRNWLKKERRFLRLTGSVKVSLTATSWGTFLSSMMTSPSSSLMTSSLIQQWAPTTVTHCSENFSPVWRRRISSSW